MLCEDPGCHLLAIVVVNLTFGDAELNRDLLSMGGGGEVQLVDCLGYALLVSLPVSLFRPSREKLTHSSFRPSIAHRHASFFRFAPLSSLPRKKI
jgi:hypothetical protein